jgi:iron(III) transport system substrate-binding protein
MYSRPILEEFTKRTGVSAQAVYDTEAAKTSGLVNRLIAEKGSPRCDVFWNNEVAQTIVLKEKGIVEPYLSPAANAIPAKYKDPKGYWTGFAARGRVIIYNTDLVGDPPKSVLEFTDPKWSGRAAIALPLYGTTATHVAALFAAMGEEKAKAFLHGISENKVAILNGNATVRDFVAKGEYAVGWTDSDDANGAVEDGFPVKWFFPDQGPDEMGTLVIPNTVALVKGGPNEKGGKALIDYLLSPEVEARLAAMRSIQIPLNPSVPVPKNVPDLAKIKTMDIPFEKMAQMMPVSQECVRREFRR